MILNKSFIRRYRFDENMVLQLSELKKYHIKESDFVRSAIMDKLRELPQIRDKHNKIKLPF